VFLGEHRRLSPACQLSRGALLCSPWQEMLIAGSKKVELALRLADEEADPVAAIAASAAGGMGRYVLDAGVALACCCDEGSRITGVNLLMTLTVGPRLSGGVELRELRVRAHILDSAD
jgi:hypothetical protein